MAVQPAEVAGLRGCGEDSPVRMAAEDQRDDAAGEVLVDAASSTAIRTPGHPNRPDGWVDQWGAQIRPPTVVRGLPGAEVTEQHVAGYLAEYATKATEAAGHLSTRLTESTVRLYAEPAKHTGRLIAAAWDLGRPAAGPGWFRLRPWPTCSASAATSPPNPAPTRPRSARSELPARPRCAEQVPRPARPGRRTAGP